VFVAVLVGATLGGVAGAFVAVPLAAIVDLFLRDVVVPGAAVRSGRNGFRLRPEARPAVRRDVCACVLATWIDAPLIA